MGCPGVRNCRPTCQHKAMVEGFRLARHNEELRREAATGSYASEMASYGPLITYKEWLRSWAGSQQSDVA